MLYSFNDWWSYIRIKASLSILCQSPFPGEDEEEVFDSIVNDDVQYPGCLSPDSISIIQKVTTSPFSAHSVSHIFYIFGNRSETVQKYFCYENISVCF